jgi:hypothetical protein
MVFHREKATLVTPGTLKNALSQTPMPEAANFAEAIGLLRHIRKIFRDDINVDAFWESGHASRKPFDGKVRAVLGGSTPEARHYDNSSHIRRERAQQNAVAQEKSCDLSVRHV